MPHHKSHTEKHGHTTKTEKLKPGDSLSELCEKLKFVAYDAQCGSKCIDEQACPCDDIKKIYEEFCR